MRSANSLAALSIVWLLAPFVSGCAGTSRDASLPINDPNEHWNRGVLAVNQAVLGPPAQLVKALPGPVRDRLHDLDANLHEPRVFANNLLQLRFHAASLTLGRFLANSTFGIGGLFDVASLSGDLPQQTGDFGQTLFVWGVDAGPYVVTPYFGPSTTRDSVGAAVDIVADPIGWSLSPEIGISWAIGAGALGATVHLAEFKQAEESSIDFYSFLRSAYYQTRRGQLRDAIGLPREIESPATAAGSH
jgi:phospholipid-binding lipoprotein MlaA